MADKERTPDDTIGSAETLREHTTTADADLSVTPTFDTKQKRLNPDGTEQKPSDTSEQFKLDRSKTDGDKKLS